MTTVTEIAERSPNFQMPTDGELKQLFALVVTRHPRFAGDDFNTVFPLFKNCFWAVNQFGRKNEFDTGRSASWWASEASNMCERAGLRSQDFGQGLFCACVLASGDILHSIGPRYPFDLAFGLSIGTSGRMAGTAWKNVLHTSRLLEPETVSAYGAQQSVYEAPRPRVLLQDKNGDFTVEQAEANRLWK